MQEFGRSVYENARVCFRLWEFYKDLPESRYLDVAQYGLHLKKFQVRIFFCEFKPWFQHNFNWDVRSSEVQCNGGTAWIWRGRCLRKGLKVYNLLEESFVLCVDVLPLLSGEDCFWPLSPCFWVAPSTIWSDIYVLNIGLSLLLSVKISIMTKIPLEIVNNVVVVQLIWPLVASGGIFGSHRKL